MTRWFTTIFTSANWPLVLIIILTQFIASYLVNLLSYRNLMMIYPLFKTRKWEKKGNIYQTIFHVKAWKEYIPSVGSFDKKNMERTKITPNFIAQFLLESLRAELCHLYAFIFALVLLLFTATRAWFFVLAYTIIFNLPCIIIQRYNRPRFERLIRTKDEKGNVVFPEFWKDANGDSMSGREERDEKRRQARARKEAERLEKKNKKKSEI